MATEKRLIFLEDAIAKIVDTPSVIAERLAKCEYGYYQNPDVLVDRQHEIIDLLMDVPTVDADINVLTKKISKLEKSNRNWRRKYQRLKATRKAGGERKDNG